jgi:hypothetical protein
MTEYQRRFVERLKPFIDRGWDLVPSSNRTRNPDLSPAGWIAKVQVMKHDHSHTTVLPLSAGSKKTYVSKEQADSEALWMGLRWLSENAY